MSDRILVSTRKGLFALERGNDSWNIADHFFIGDNVAQSLADPRDGSCYAVLDQGAAASNAQADLVA